MHCLAGRLSTCIVAHYKKCHVTLKLTSVHGVQTFKRMLGSLIPRTFHKVLAYTKLSKYGIIRQTLSPIALGMP